MVKSQLHTKFYSPTIDSLRFFYLDRSFCAKNSKNCFNSVIFFSKFNHKISKIPNVLLFFTYESLLNVDSCFVVTFIVSNRAVCLSQLHIDWAHSIHILSLVVLGLFCQNTFHCCEITKLQQLHQHITFSPQVSKDD